MEHDEGPHHHHNNRPPVLALESITNAPPAGPRSKQTQDRPHTARPENKVKIHAPDKDVPTRARPSTAGTTRSPYSVIPTGIQAPSSSSSAANSRPQSAARSVYVKIQRPPSSREYRPLRSSSALDIKASSRGMAAAQSSDWGAAKDMLGGDVDNMRPHSARAPTAEPAEGGGGDGGYGARPPLSARGRMQGAANQVRRATTFRRVFGGPGSGSGEGGEGRDGEEGRGSGSFKSSSLPGGVVALPRTSSAGSNGKAGMAAFQPPEPVAEDPTPRRRPVTRPVSASDGMNLANAKALREMGGAYGAVASITHGKTVQSVVQRAESACIVILSVDACRLCLFDQQKGIMSLARLHMGNQELKVSGVTGLVANTGTFVSTKDLFRHEFFDPATDCTSAPSEGIPIAALCGPCKDSKQAVIEGVFSVQRVGGVPFTSEEEELFRLICQQVGVGLNHARMFAALEREKYVSKLLVKASIELSKSNMARGPLAIAAGVYAKKLTDATEATVFELHGRKQFVRFWELTGKGGKQSGEAKLMERDHVIVPKNLKRVVSGVVVNQVIQGGADVTGGASTEDMDRDGGVISVYDADVNNRAITFEDACDNLLVVPLRVDAMSAVVGFIVVRNKHGGPSKQGKHGLFDKQDEEALKDLSNVVASVLSRADAVTEQASALSMMPSLATARSVAQCVGMLQQHIQIALKADKAIVFLLLPNGNLALHDRGHLSDVTYPTSMYPFTLMAGAGRGAHRLKLKAMKEYSSFKEGSVMRQLASASALVFSPIRSPSASGMLHGCVFAVQTRDGHFHDTHSNLLENITFQAGAVLDNCAALQQHRDNALHHQTSSLQLIQVVNKREIEGVIRHVEEMMPNYMCCQRAVLYMIDWDRGVVWTLLPDDELLTYDIVPEAMSMSKGEGKIGSEDEASQTQSEAAHDASSKDVMDSASFPHTPTTPPKAFGGFNWNMSFRGSVGRKSEDFGRVGSNQSSNGLGRRIGGCNCVLITGGAHNVTDFAYGQPEFNEMLDTANVKKAELLHRKHSQRQNGGGLVPGVRSQVPEAEWHEEEELTESMAAVPVTDNEGRIIAVLEVMNRLKDTDSHKLRKEGFDENDIQKMGLVTAAVSCALDSCAVMERRWDAEFELRGIVDSCESAQELALGAAARIDVGDALQHAAKTLSEGTRASQMAVYFLDRDDDTMDIIRFEGNLFRPSKRMKNGLEGIAGSVITTGKPLQLAEVRSHPLYKQGVDDRTHIPAFTGIYAPIHASDGAVIGCLVAQNRKLGRRGDDEQETTNPLDAAVRRRMKDEELGAGGFLKFGQNDARCLAAAAKGISLSLSNSELLGRVSNLAERIKDVSSEIDMTVSLQNLGRACAHLAHAEGGMVYMADEKAREFRDETEDGHSGCPMHLGLLGGVMSLGGSVHVRSRRQIDSYLAELEEYEKDLDTDLGFEARKRLLKYIEHARGMRTAMGVPLYDPSGRIVGVVEVWNRIGVDAVFQTTDERIVASLLQHAYTHIMHSRGYSMCVTRLSLQQQLMGRIVGLMEHVASFVGKTVPEGEIFGHIVKTACDLLGAKAGKFYILLTGRVVVYDHKGGKQFCRPSNIAIRAMEANSLINNTSSPIVGVGGGEGGEGEGEGGDEDEDEEDEDEDAYERKGRVIKPGEVRSLAFEFSDYPTGQGDPDRDFELEEKKYMAAPVERASSVAKGKKGPVVTAALEVEAQSYDHEWKSEDEATIRLIAHVSGSVLDMIDNIKLQVAKTQPKGATFLDAHKDSQQSPSRDQSAEKSTVGSPSSPDNGNESPRSPRSPRGGHRMGGGDGGSSPSSRGIAVMQ